jgi:hypothetical protein
MGTVELLGLAASVSLLAGWRLYLCVFATGLAMRSGWLELPTQLDALAALANPWVIGASLVALIAEFLADKVAWIDSIWDSVHAFIRPLGGALLSLAIVDANDPAWQAAAFILGGGGALLSHSAKMGTRALVNLSPEPVSNVVVSTGEDVATGGMLALALASPEAAVAIALILIAAAAVLLYYARRAMRALLRVRDRMLPSKGGSGERESRGS